MGFTLSTHYCGGHAVESVLAIGGQDLDCGMMNMEQQHTSTSDTVDKEPCCSNEYSQYRIEGDYNVEVMSIDVNSTFLFAFVYSYLSDSFDEVDSYKPYLCYTSPPLPKDIPVLHQSFLI